ALGILSWIYASYGQISIVQALFFGLKAAVLAVVLEAVMRVGRRALKNKVMVIVAILSFIGIFIFALPFPFIILVAALIGYIGNKSGSKAF
ncbi:chromate transporter, partial [Mycobacterium tuberculosis]|nr:chromate transporter [Mycobacterium tuberculosis]